MNERESDYPDPDLRAGAGAKGQRMDLSGIIIITLGGACPRQSPLSQPGPLSFYAGTRLVPPEPGPAVLGWPRLLRMSGSTRGKLLPLPSLV